MGAYRAYKIAKRRYNCQLVLVGSYASDDPEGEEVYKEILNTTSDDNDVLVFDLPPSQPL